MSKRWLKRTAIPAVLSMILGGCGPKAETPEEAKPAATPPKVELKADSPKVETPKNEGTKTDVVPASTAKATRFRDCVLLDPPDGELRPPDMTMGGKSVPKMFVAISTDGGLWDSIAFQTAEGKKIRYSADIKTDQGVIKLDLLSDEAPNHVRSFIALAKAGYYNGLSFHQSIRQDVMGTTMAYLEAGCPKGTGEAGYGSIGYWLKPEISPALVHDEGTVGAWHGENPETAACKFYVTLCKSPWMDERYTIFGKIVSGLDIARTINARPTRDDAFKDRPLEPVIIRDVAIHAKVLD